MRHPSDGTLRRLVDEPDGVADPDREHVAGCPECLSGLAAAQEDAALTSAAFELDVTSDVDAAWQRLSHATGDTSVRRSLHQTRDEGPDQASPVAHSIGTDGVLHSQGSSIAS